MNRVMRVSAKQLPCPLEIEEQSTIIQFLKIARVDFHSVPNGFYLPNPHKKGSIAFYVQAQANKKAAVKALKEGLTSGVSDLIIFGKKKILYLEVKRVKGSRKSADQIKVQGIVNRYPYAEYHFAHGASEAIVIIKQFI